CARATGLVAQLGRSEGAVNWVIVTAAYPPDEGGVADYTVLLANALAAMGDEVWIFAGSGDQPDERSPHIHVRRFPGHFGFRALRQMSTALDELPSQRQIVLQYVPQAFGPRAWRNARRFRGVPLSLCLWLQTLREPVWTMFHELVAVPGPSL